MGLSVYMRVIRPHIVLGGILGYTLGVLLAYYCGGVPDFVSAVLGYAVILFWDLSTHFNNNYYDVEADSRSSGKTFGGHNVLVDFPEALPGALRIAAMFSVLSTGLALLMVSWMGFSPLILVLAFGNNVLGWLYSAPPFRLVSSVFGELVLAVGTGFTVPAVGFVVILGEFSPIFLVLSVCLVLYGLVLGLSLAYPDLEVDRMLGRKNLAVYLGWSRLGWVVFLLNLCAFGVLVLFSWGFGGWFIPFFGLVPLFASVYGVRWVPSCHGEADMVSIVNVVSLFMFLLLFDGFLLLSFI